MASYFVASPALAEGTPAVHDRSRCPPALFPLHGCEYLGEFQDVSQAIAVARLRYRHAAACACCARVLRGGATRRMLSDLRS